MFEFVHPIAIIGTTCFMMAIATLWYSEYFALRRWMRAVGKKEEDLRDPHVVRRSTLITGGVFLCLVYLIAVSIGYAQVAGLQVQSVALGILALIAAFLAWLVVWEGRSLTYYLISVGYATIFVLGSTFLLYHWPW